jgi:hypothetical protein
MWVIPKITLDFIERMLDVLEVYERPYDPKFPVVCVDEKSKQLLKEVRNWLRMKPGKPKRQDYEYERNGTVNMFVAVEPRGGKRAVRVTKHRRKRDWAFFIRYLVDVVYKDAEKIILVEDNLNTHNEQTLIDVFGEKTGKRIGSKIEWHFTPEHASWLNQAEIEIHSFETQVLKKRIGTFQKMQSEIAACVRYRNQKYCMINWQFTRNKAITKFHLN